MRGNGHRDEELIAARRKSGEYTHPESYVSVDAREYLFGADKLRRYREVWRRDKHRCVVCAVYVPFREMEPDHVIKRSAGGDDRAENLRTMCHTDHRGPEGRHR